MKRSKKFLAIRGLNINHNPDLKNIFKRAAIRASAVHGPHDESEGTAKPQSLVPFPGLDGKTISPLPHRCGGTISLDIPFYRTGLAAKALAQSDLAATRRVGTVAKLCALVPFRGFLIA